MRVHDLHTTANARGEELEELADDDALKTPQKEKPRQPVVPRRPIAPRKKDGTVCILRIHYEYIANALSR